MSKPLESRTAWPPPLPKRPDLSAFGEVPIAPWFEWSVGSVLDALAAHEQGMFFQSALLSDYILRDDRVSASLSTRVNAVLGLPFQIKPSPQVKRPRRAIEEALAEDWPRMFSRAVLGELQRWGRLMGFAIGELVWHTEGERWIPEIRVWHPANVWYYLTSKQYALNTLEGTEFIQPGDGKWFLYRPHSEYRGWMHAAIRCLAILTLLRQYCLRDMGRAGELFGLGVKKAKVPTDAAQGDKARFKAQLSRLASEALIVLPEWFDKNGKLRAFDFEFAGIDVGAGAAELFNSLAARCDSGITLALLGQNLTSEVKEGSLAAARVHGDVRQDYLEADVQTITEDIRAQVIRPWAQYNFGDADLAPIATWDPTPPEDLQASADALSKLADALDKLTKCAPEVDRTAILTKFGVPVLPTPVDEKKAGQIFAYHLQAGVVTANEVRASLNLPPVTGGDELLQPPSPGADAVPSPDAEAA